MSGLRGMLNKAGRSFAWLLPLAVLFSHCLSQPDCLRDATNQVKINLRKKGKAVEVTFERITVSGSAEVFYVNKKQTALTLPLNPNEPETTFGFFYESKSVTVTLAYTKQLRLISADCGMQTYFLDLAMVGGTLPLDSVRVLNPVLLRNAPANVEIGL